MNLYIVPFFGVVSEFVIIPLKILIKLPQYIREVHNFFRLMPMKSAATVEEFCQQRLAGSPPRLPASLLSIAG